MSDSAVILALIATVSFIGMSCLIMDIILTKEERIVIRPKPRVQTKPQHKEEEYELLVDEDCFDN